MDYLVYLQMQKAFQGEWNKILSSQQRLSINVRFCQERSLLPLKIRHLNAREEGYLWHILLRAAQEIPFLAPDF